MFKIFITNLGKYNEGQLIGKWLNLPCQNIEKELESIGVKKGSAYEEAFITDYENDWDYEVGEYEEIYLLNNMVKKLQKIGKANKKWLLAYCEAIGMSLAESIENNEYQNSIFYEDQKMVDVTRELFNMWLDTEIKDEELKQLIQWHFDYEIYAEELLTGHYYDTKYGVIYI